MKANELMIGDWLWYRGQFNDFPFKVELITKRKVGYHSEPCENKMHYLRLHECQPIPLTTDILEENFPDDNDGVVWRKWWKNDKPFYHVECMPLNGTRIIIPFAQYVHQLQHAMNLSGIEKEITLNRVQAVFTRLKKADQGNVTKIPRYDI